MIVITTVACCFPSHVTASEEKYYADVVNVAVPSSDIVTADEIDPTIVAEEVDVNVDNGDEAVDPNKQTTFTTNDFVEENIEVPVVNSKIIDPTTFDKNTADIIFKEIDAHVEELKRVKEQAAIRASFCYETDQKSNIPSEMLREVIRIVLTDNGITDSKLYGIEDAVLKAENYASMNALDILAIMSLESSYGTSYSARVRNNLVGATNDTGRIQYGSIDDSIEHFGKFMGDYYISQGRTTLESIAPKYCPPENDKWLSNVKAIKQHYIEVLKTL